MDVLSRSRGQLKLDVGLIVSAVYAELNKSFGLFGNVWLPEEL